MAVIKKDGNFMGLPMNIARGNPIPLDTTAVWYSYDEMAEYAKSGVTAYVGQILAHVDETNNTSTAYIILNTNGDLQTVGSAILTDEKTIVLTDGIIGLKDFGSKYYRYVAETTDEETQETIAAHYELQEVDADHPWAAGLEPKVVSENGELVLGWYEPNPTTIEGINTQVSGIQTTVNDLKDVTNDLQEDVSALEEKIGDPANSELGTEATGIYKELENIYTRDETDSAIATAIAKVDHLSKTVVESKGEINVNAENADNYIYLVPIADSSDYEEYMVINGVLELIGTTKVDLSGYATLTQLEEKVDKKTGYDLVSNEEITKLSTVEENAQENVIDTVDETVFGLENKHLTLKPIAITKVEGLEEALQEIPSSEDLAKLENVIEGVNEEQFTIDENKILQLNSIGIDSVEGLNEALENKVSAEEGKGLSSNDLTDEMVEKINLIDGIDASIDDINTILNGYTDAESGEEIPGLQTIVSNLQTDVDDLEKTVGTMETTIKGLSETLSNDYVLKTTFNSTVGDLTTLTTETQTSLVDAINELDSRLKWEEL